MYRWPAATSCGHRCDSKKGQAPTATYEPSEVHLHSNISHETTSGDGIPLTRNFIFQRCIVNVLITTSVVMRAISCIDIVYSGCLVSTTKSVDISQCALALMSLMPPCTALDKDVPVGSVLTFD
jgi:hypothetical protein